MEDYKIHGEATNSNHNPSFLAVQLELDLNHPSKWKMSTAYLKEVKAQAQTLWQSFPPETPFFYKLHRLIRFYKAYCNTKVIAFRAEEAEARQKLESDTADLQANPNGYASQVMHSISRVHLQASKGSKWPDAVLDQEFDGRHSVTQ